jgi:hypothetical protein
LVLREAREHSGPLPHWLVEAAVDNDVGVEAGRCDARLASARVVNRCGGRELKRGEKRENNRGD